MGVHFMPFSLLFEYMEACLIHGSEFFFKFGIAWLQYLETHLMLAKNTSELTSLLRNEHPTDHCKCHPGLFKSGAEEVRAFEEVLARAHSVNLSRFADFAELREQKIAEFAKIMLSRKER